MKKIKSKDSDYFIRFTAGTENTFYDLLSEYGIPSDIKKGEELKLVVSKVDKEKGILEIIFERKN